MRVRGLHARLKESLSDRLDLVLENLALRHQLMVCERGRRLRGADRLWWCVLSRFWPRWRNPLTLVQPATVLRWRRMAWRRHLRGQRRRRRGRPRIDAELQVLIQRMAAENRLWGSIRIKGELRKLGLEVSNSTVRRYRTAVRRSPARQSWATFLQNHGPYLREALGEEVRGRARGLLGMLPRLGSPARARLGSRSEMWRLQIPGEYLEPIEERWGEWWCDCPACERAPRAARDPPVLRRDAA